ncbi:MAG: putative bifunctional diguanylate cyclase/phosphodiesterase [Caulobacteraceae bacterium]
METKSSLVWDPATALEALGASEAALWLWEPNADRLRLTGAVHALGLAALAPECPSAAIRALVQPAERAGLDELLRTRQPGREVSATLSFRRSPPCLWRGVWLEEGERAAGLLVKQERFALVLREPVTGLMDRRAFLAGVHEVLAAEGEYELIIADLNRLRRLNEALGPDRADLVLAALGARLSAAFSSEALMGRIGDNEFAVLTPAGRTDAARILRGALERPMRVAGFDIFPTFAIGAVTVEGGPAAPNAVEIIRRAELAVEAAKAAGASGAAAYGADLESHGPSRLSLESDLRGALGRGEITAHFQPIVRLSTGELSGFEALARWRHPRKGLLAPDDFLPMMGEMGLMSQLGSRMMGLAAAQLGAWRAAHPNMGALTVAVNLSTGEIDRDDLIAEVATLIADNALPPGALKLEITESDIMRDPERATILLRSLREAGAALALDDFGTGFSSLSYLSRLPFDTLKIDRYFVRTMAANAGSAKIVRSVIKLGQDLDLEVIAEGVENAIMAGKLLALGCDYGQGFGYAPALSPQEAEVYLNESYADGAAPLKARG